VKTLPMSPFCLNQLETPALSPSTPDGKAPGRHQDKKWRLGSLNSTPSTLQRFILHRPGPLRLQLGSRQCKERDIPLLEPCRRPAHVPTCVEPSVCPYGQPPWTREWNAACGGHGFPGMWEATSQCEIEPSMSALLAQMPHGKSRGVAGQKYWGLVYRNYNSRCIDSLYS
jgi:hypothetical protein